MASLGPEPPPPVEEEALSAEGGDPEGMLRCRGVCPQGCDVPTVLKRPGVPPPHPVLKAV